MKPTDIAGEASDHWDYLSSLLEAEGRLTLSDGPLLTAGAIAYAIGMRLTRALMNPETPLWVVYSRPEPDGNERQEVEKHPIFGEERAQWERYRKCCNDLCLSAGTRARARGAAPTTAKSKVDKFRASKQSA